MSVLGEPLQTAQFGQDRREVGFAIGVIVILTILFLPIPPALIDIGLALSIAASVLVLMVALWIQKPLDFSAFPTVLLIVTLLRLSLNIASTRLILSNGSEGYNAAGHVIGGFSSFVMSGDFVIGLVVFAIIITVNFLVITKGATRIAEVGARFTLDAIPGKQMAIDADLSAGLLTEQEAQRRRRELEDESSFFGSMDGASKFVRGDAIAGLIITTINIIGGIIIGVTRHGMQLQEAADIFTKLSVGDGLVSQIPALIVSLAAGLLVSKGGNRGSMDKAVLGQLGKHPLALMVAALLMFILAALPGLPAIPFAALGIMMAFAGYTIHARTKKQEADTERNRIEEEEKSSEEERNSVSHVLQSAQVELALGKQLSGKFIAEHGELAHRVAKMRRKFAEQYGFVVPEMRLTDDIRLPPKRYEIRIHGTVVASGTLRLGDVMVLTGDDTKLDIPGEEAYEPAFGMKGLWVSEYVAESVRGSGHTVIDNLSMLLTHVSEVLRNNLSQLLSYRDLRALLDRLDPEYQRLLEELCPSQISYSILQSALKLLLAERVSIRNLHLIIEAVAEVAAHTKKPELIAEHVRMRLSQQVCGELIQDGKMKVLQLGTHWNMVFHRALKRDPNGDVVELDVEPGEIEKFSKQASQAIREQLDRGHEFALVTAPDVRPYVRMVVERMFSAVPVISHVEIARGVELESLGTVV